MEQVELTVDITDNGKRIDKWLSESELKLTRSAVQHLIEIKNITVNGKNISKSYKLNENDKIIVKIPDPVPLDVEPENIPLDIVYEDDDLLVVNKPKGIVVHPAPGNYSGTLVNALLYHCGGRLSSINGIIRPGIVHRIDKLTSGLLVVAKNDISHNFLAKQIKDHSFTREYQAIVVGRLKEKNGTIDAPIGRSRIDRKKMCVTYENSRNAVTHYEVIDEFNNYSLLKFNLETGRTHQIRVHSAYIGHSVYGDEVYGKAVKGVNGQCLHAKKLGFIHPSTNEYMEFDSDLPDYFISILNKLK
ncbi:MAG: RluA family pseudouridine synthase [Oscillospiraceae bacterium]